MKKCINWINFISFRTYIIVLFQFKTVETVENLMNQSYLLQEFFQNSNWWNQMVLDFFKNSVGPLQSVSFRLFIKNEIEGLLFFIGNIQLFKNSTAICKYSDRKCYTFKENTMLSISFLPRGISEKETELESFKNSKQSSDKKVVDFAFVLQAISSLA